MRGLLLAVLLTTSTAATETLFDLFGISQVELPGLDDSQLKKLYKRRALELHPDKSDHPDAEDRFRRLQEAYEGLKDPSTRSYFARFGQYDVWRNVKEYADEKLHHTRRGWVRTRRGVQMASERVDIRDEFVRGDGRYYPYTRIITTEPLVLMESPCSSWRTTTSPTSPKNRRMLSGPSRRG